MGAAADAAAAFVVLALVLQVKCSQQFSYHYLELPPVKSAATACSVPFVGANWFVKFTHFLCQIPYFWTEEGAGGFPQSKLGPLCLLRLSMSQVARDPDDMRRRVGLEGSSGSLDSCDVDGVGFCVQAQTDGACIY